MDADDRDLAELRLARAHGEFRDNYLRLRALILATTKLLGGLPQEWDRCLCGHQRIQHEVRCVATGCPCLGYDDAADREYGPLYSAEVWADSFARALAMRGVTAPRNDDDPVPSEISELGGTYR